MGWLGFPRQAHFARKVPALPMICISAPRIQNTRSIESARRSMFSQSYKDCIEGSQSKQLASFENDVNNTAEHEDNEASYEKKKKDECDQHQHHHYRQCGAPPGLDIRELCSPYFGADPVLCYKLRRA